MSILSTHLSAVLAVLPPIARLTPSAQGPEGWPLQHVTITAPPGADKFLTVVGWVFWGFGLAFLLAAAGALVALAWARWHGGRSFMAGAHLGVIAGCAAAFSVIGQLMAPLVS